MAFVWWLAITISTAAVVYFGAILLPKVLLRMEYTISTSPDRGLKSFKEEDARSIVYEPKSEYRKYISQYILSTRDGQRVLLAKVGEGVKRLDYDVVLFNRFNKAFKVLNVREAIEGETTRALKIPSRAVYAAVIVNDADGTKPPNCQGKRTPKASFFFFGAIILAIVVGQCFFIKQCLANIYADIFVEEFMFSLKSTFITLGIALLAGIFNLFIVFSYIAFRLKAGAK